MKSPMITGASYIPKKDGYSELQVLRSNAGWYVGTMYWNTDEPTHHYEEPGSRDSGYFKERKQAEDFLKLLEGGDNTAIESLRKHP